MSSIIYTTKEAAQRLGYSIDNINRLVFSGKLIPQKFFGKNIFTEDEIQRFEEYHKKNHYKRIKNVTCHE
jgi:predicted site-specific integrase-resolvase